MVGARSVGRGGHDALAALDGRFLHGHGAGHAVELVVKTFRGAMSVHALRGRRSGGRKRSSDEAYHKRCKWCARSRLSATTA